ncbi:DUF2835 family protein [Gammaproteobacteria bacterium AB-CW1]|uniref:DUF2835 family protein n=1 Tax=Natronospira elongata TaxID=3110268 RepID=A0AAP6MLG6_9GAMM|nr:DUF2835 family protein [Gammaproteobacteria bacterium AB-CW1]
MRDEESICRIIFQINLERQDMENYYAGRLTRFAGLSEDGRRVVLPASAFRPFVTESGVHGRFELVYQLTEKRIVSLRRLAPNSD